MVLKVFADKLGASEAAGIDLGLPFEEKRRVFEGGKSNGRRSTTWKTKTGSKIAGLMAEDKYVRGA